MMACPSTAIRQRGCWERSSIGCILMRYVCEGEVGDEGNPSRLFFALYHLFPYMCICLLLTSSGFLSEV